jgi:hypothetical protein
MCPKIHGFLLLRLDSAAAASAAARSCCARRMIVNAFALPASLATAETSLQELGVWWREVGGEGVRGGGGGGVRMDYQGNGMRLPCCRIRLLADKAVAFLELCSGAAATAVGIVDIRVCIIDCRSVQAMVHVEGGGVGRRRLRCLRGCESGSKSRDVCQCTCEATRWRAGWRSGCWRSWAAEGRSAGLREVME